MYLHIGAMKTGTSYLQRLLSQNKTALARDGMLFPGASWGDQIHGVREILQLRADDEQRVAMRGGWDRLRQEIAEYDGRAALISMEFLSFARPARARALVESLAPANVQVVLGVRDAGRVLPAQWQESTKNRGTTSWPEYADALLRHRRNDPAWRTGMRSLQIPRMLDVWGPLVPPERLHIVVVPPPGSASTLLWERFAAASSLQPGRYAPPEVHRNESLGYASADLMRRVNRGAAELPRSSYRRIVKTYLCKRVLAARSGEPKVPLTPELGEFAKRWNDKMIEAISKAGGHVHGGLDDLAVDASVTAREIALPSDEALLDAANHALAALAWFEPDRGDSAAADRATSARTSPSSVDAAVEELTTAIYRSADRAEQLHRQGQRALPPWDGPS